MKEALPPDRRPADQPGAPRRLTTRREMLYRTVISGTAAAFGLLWAIPLARYFLSPLGARPEERRLAERWAPVARLNDVLALAPNTPAGYELRYRVQEGWLERVTERLIYLVRLENNEILALSNICTHLGCPVRWQEQREEFLCPCHGGLYDVYGAVAGGPPPRDLPRFETRVDGGMVYVKNPALGWPG